MQPHRHDDPPAAFAQIDNQLRSVLFTIVVEEITAGTGPAAVTGGDAAGSARSPESSGFSAGALISGVLGMLPAAGLLLLGRRGRPAAAVRS
jgi:hypothetical protein